MEASAPAQRFDHLREHSIGLPQVLFQSITHMAPGAAVAYSIYISVPFSQQALALWMLFSNTGKLNVQPFEPHNALGGWSGVFRGMVFAILAFIGFEASAPLGEEARNPRRTIPRAASSRPARVTASEPPASASFPSRSLRRPTPPAFEGLLYMAASSFDGHLPAA